MQIGDRAKIKIMRLGDYGPEPDYLMATVMATDPPSGFTVKYDELQNGYLYRAFPYDALGEIVTIMQMITYRCVVRSAQGAEEHFEFTMPQFASAEVACDTLAEAIKKLKIWPHEIQVLETVMDIVITYPCPRCGSETDWKLECPGYAGSDGKIMVCYPYCGNAIEFFCTNRACHWWYRAPNNRADAAEMPAAPLWIGKALTEMGPSEDERI